MYEPSELKQPPPAIRAIDEKAQPKVEDAKNETNMPVATETAELKEPTVESIIKPVNEANQEPETKETSVIKNATKIPDAKQSIKVKSEEESTKASEEKTVPQMNIANEAANLIDETTKVKQEMVDNNFLTPDQWPQQAFPPIKLAEIKFEPVTVSIPSNQTALPPLKFKNNFKLGDFQVSEYPQTSWQSNDEFMGNLYEF